MKMLFTAAALASATLLSAGETKLTAVPDAAKGTVTVKAGDEVFTTLHYKNFAKPILHPINLPGAGNLVREWPVAAAAPNEEQDHPHHKGLWFTHGAVNGVDFWKEAADAGKIIVTGEPAVSGGDGKPLTLTTSENWVAPDGKKVCTSSTTITCGTESDARFIDYTITISASEGDVTFGDTKEGTMGIRSHPALNLKGKVAAGKAVNSEGLKDGAIWGKPARWVDYFAPVGGKTVGIACFDHPSNLRHPTTWHARDYGLIAANPFGLHDFDKRNPKGTGDLVIKKGESLTLKYRWLFHAGDTEGARIEERYKIWAASK